MIGIDDASIILHYTRDLYLLFSFLSSRIMALTTVIINLYRMIYDNVIIVRVNGYLT